MHLGTEMMLGVVAVVEEEPIVNLAVIADAPRDRLVGIPAVVAKVTVQVAEAVPQIKEGQEKQHVAPVDKMDRPGRNDQRHGQQNGDEYRELDRSPAHFR